jgi:hypothetical protein
MLASVLKTINIEQWNLLYVQVQMPWNFLIFTQNLIIDRILL